MTRVLHRPRADEALIPVASAIPPAAHLTGDHSGRRIDFDDMDGFDGMPAGWQPGRDASRLNHDAIPTALAELRTADAPVPPTAIRDVHDRGTWLPASVGLAQVPLTTPRPLPTIDTIAYLAAVATAMHADYERHLDTLAVIDAIADLPVHLRAVTMALAPIVAQLDGE